MLSLYKQWKTILDKIFWNILSPQENGSLFLKKKKKDSLILKYTEPDRTECLLWSCFNLFKYLKDLTHTGLARFQPGKKKNQSFIPFFPPCTPICQLWELGKKIHVWKRWRFLRSCNYAQDLTIWGEGLLGEREELYSKSYTCTFIPNRVSTTRWFFIGIATLLCLAAHPQYAQMINSSSSSLLVSLFICPAMSSSSRSQGTSQE